MKKLVKRVPVEGDLVYSPGYIAPSGTFYPGRLSVHRVRDVGRAPAPPRVFAGATLHSPKLVVVGYQKDATQDEFRSVGERIRYILRVGLERLECEARDYVDTGGNWLDESESTAKLAEFKLTNGTQTKTFIAPSFESALLMWLEVEELERVNWYFWDHERADVMKATIPCGDRKGEPQPYMLTIRRIGDVCEACGGKR